MDLKRHGLAVATAAILIGVAGIVLSFDASDADIARSPSSDKPDRPAVQDAAAALPAKLLGDVRGLRVADLCAAPGGKSA